MNQIIGEPESVDEKTWLNSEFSLERLIESFLKAVPDKEHHVNHKDDSINGSVAAVMMSIMGNLSIENSIVIIQMISKIIISILIELLKEFELNEHPIMNFIDYLKDNNGLGKLPSRKTVNDLIDKKRTQPIEEIQREEQNKMVNFLQRNDLIENNIHITGDTHCRELETKERSKNVRGIIKGQQELPLYGHHFEMTQLTNLRLMFNANILPVAPYSLGNTADTPINQYLNSTYQQIEKLGLRITMSYYDRGYYNDEFFAKIYLGQPNYPEIAVIPHRSDTIFGDFKESDDKKLFKLREEMIMNNENLRTFRQDKLLGSKALKRIPHYLRNNLVHIPRTKETTSKYYYGIAYAAVLNENARSELRDGKTIKDALIINKNELEKLEKERENRVRYFHNAWAKHVVHKKGNQKPPTKFKNKPIYKSHIVNNAYLRIQLIDNAIKKKNREIKTLISSVQLYTIAYRKDLKRKLTDHLLKTICLQYEKRFGIECSFLLMKEHFQIPHHYSPGNSIRELSYITLEYLVTNYFRLNQLQCLYNLDNPKHSGSRILNKLRPAILNKQPSKKKKDLPTIIEFKTYWCEKILKNWFSIRIQKNIKEYKSEVAIGS